MRDLGLADANHGAYDAWITRGWVKMNYTGEGEFELKAGDFVYLPPKHVHDFMEYSDEIEIFELAAPVDHNAIDV